MPKSNKPRKRYRPHLVNGVAHLRAMNAVTKLSATEVEQGATAVEAALHAFIDGNDPAFQWAVMADALNVAEQLSNEGICSDLASRDMIAQGQKTLASLHGAIRLAGHDWGLVNLKPEQIASLTDAIEMHRIQLTLCDYSEYRRAIETVIRRMKAARAGSVAAGTTILEAIQ